MKLREIINPWGALKEAHADIADYESERVAFFASQRDLRSRAESDAKAHDLKVKNLKAEIRRLEAVIANGHYRNPKTGRIGRKGERFDAGAAH